MKKNLLFSVMIAAFSFMSLPQYAQQTIPCSTSEVAQQLRALHPELAQDWENYKTAVSQKQGKSYRSTQTYIIPVVFHILYTTAAQNISDAQIFAQITRLNTDYRKLNTDLSTAVNGFDTIADDVNIEFRLAKLDPDGICTNGIDRIYTHKTYQAGESAKLNQWPREKYLNIWVVNDIAGSTASATILGYAHFPSDVATMLFPYDGIIAIYGTVNGTSRTLTHEIGHFLSLEHPWGSTNSPGVACGDDGVTDTPDTKGHFSTCPLTDATCNPPIIENVQNYMDYSSCTCMFTKGQVIRMRNAIESPVSGRNNLWTTANLLATGVEPSMPVVNCAPKSEFWGSRIRLCAGGAVTFTKNIMEGTDTALTWSFAGGTPATSTASSPTVTYSTPGLYDVTLTAYNGAGSNAITKTGYIRVDGTGASYYGIYSEGFETMSYSDFFWIWNVNNPDNNEFTWDRTSATGYMSSKCAVMNGYGNFPYDVDELKTPSYDLSGLTGITLSFYLAGASHAGSATDMNEGLKIYSSTNCGQLWSLRSTLTGTNLLNNGYQPDYFVPNTTTDWILKTITIPASIATSNVEFKFEYTTGNASNNIYIDNININGTVGVNENVLENSNLNIYPNPSNESSTIFYHLSKAGNAKVEILDVLGKKVFEVPAKNLAEGDYTISVSKQGENLRNGIYFVKLTVDGQSVTQKLILTQ
jgi:PKD repeat protein